MPEKQMRRSGYEVPTRHTGRRRRRRRHQHTVFKALLLGVVLLSGIRLAYVLAAGAGEPPSNTEAGGIHEKSETSEENSQTADQEGKLTADDEKKSGDWKLILVNYASPLPKDYQIPELTELRNGHKVDSRIYPELQQMMDDARAEGLDPLICSSYRTWDKQEELFEEKTEGYLSDGYAREEAEELASKWVARPGTSEHQAGLALDIVDASYQLLDEEQEQTQVQKWLMKHCAEYGFILRYPTQKSDVTGVSYEPWHYRYVGKEAAKEIMEQGITLEEYLEQ